MGPPGMIPHFGMGPPFPMPGFGFGPPPGFFMQPPPGAGPRGPAGGGADPHQAGQDGRPPFARQQRQGALMIGARHPHLVRVLEDVRVLMNLTASASALEDGCLTSLYSMLIALNRLLQAQPLKQTHAFGLCPA